MIAIPLLMLLAAAGPDEVLARANESAVTRSMFLERLKLARAVSSPSTASDLLQDLINEALLAEDARREKVDQLPEVRSAVEAARRRLAAEAFGAAELDTAVQVTDAQLLEQYHLTADSVRVQMIVYASEAEARAGLEKLARGASFEEEARHSMDPDGRGRGGDMGLRLRGQLEPALAKAVFEAAPGQTAGPVALELGWALLRVTQKTIGDEAGFQARKAEIRKFVESQARAEASAHYVSQLRKAARVAPDEKFLAATGTRVSASPEESAHPLAVVDGRPVLYGELLEEMRRVFGGREGAHLSGTRVKTEIAWRLIDRRLLEQAALARGFGEAPRVRAALPSVEREELVRAHAGRLRRAVASPSEQQLREWYQGHPEQFRTPSTRACAHILSAMENQAQVLKKRAAKERFEDLARQFSQDVETGAQGGALGDLAPGQIEAIAREGAPELAKAMKESKPGVVAGPIKSRAGWHLVRCAAPTPEKTLPFEQVREQLAQQRWQAAADEAVARRIDALRAAAKIAIDRAAFERASAAEK